MDGKNKDNSISAVIKIDGVEYNVDRDIVKHVNLLESKISTLKKDNEDFQKKLSENEGKKDALKSEIEKIKADFEKEKLNDEDIQKAVNVRLEILKIADSFEIENQNTMTDKEIKLAIIKKGNENLDLTDKDDVYINAYFDSVVHTANISLEKEAKGKNKQKVFSDYVERKGKNTISNKQEMYDNFVKKIQKQSVEYQGGASIDQNGNIKISN